VWKASGLAAVATLACAVAAPAAFRSWTRFHYTPALHDTFAQWRELLPARTEILWPEQPVGVWYLLDRPSYWSVPQTAGIVFSRPSALELNQRIGASRNALLASSAFAKVARDADSVKRLHSGTPGTLESLDGAGLPIICADRNLGYFVTARRMGPIAMPPITPDPDKPKRQLYIYNCKDFRGS
jgi:hypothetical protein